MADDTITTTSSGAMRIRQGIAQNFLLIWIDASIDESKQDCRNTLAKLRSVVNDVHIFTERDEGIDFLTEFHGMKVVLVVSGAISRHIVPLIHDVPQLNTIYIFCANTARHEQWTKEWVKIKGLYKEILPICQALQITANQRDQNPIAISFVTISEGTSTVNLNQLEPSFMYTQIFKEILFEIERDEQSIKTFIGFWRDHYLNNPLTLKVIDEFERDYHPQTSITWYTRESFIYQMLNRALRMLESDTIINMGFFIRDLHQQIEELYRKQVGSYRGKLFTLYRGQGLIKTDFEKLQKTKGGLMSFNNFLSTSKNPDVSLVFAKDIAANTDMVGILFKITIDPSVSSAPFASIRDLSYFQTEEEILFSMHTVFRIDEITKIHNDSSLYQVDLKLTADDDQELRTLTKRVREEVMDKTGWLRLGQLLSKLRQFDKVEELYNELLVQTTDVDEKATYYNNLGYIKNQQGDYSKALSYSEKALEIPQKTLPPNHPALATFYSNIASVYDSMGEYTKALSSHEKALEIHQKTLPPSHPHLATSYNNIASVYSNMGEYSKALSSLEKALEIHQKTLPPNHPLLATSFNNIGLVYDNMGEYSKALSYSEKAFEIRQKTLPPNHPDFATSYNNIASVYNNMGEYTKAFSSHEKALEIRQKTLPPNHRALATSYNNIGLVYNNMGEYTKALSSHEKALEIRQKTLSSNHPALATSYSNIASVYNNMGEYTKALSSHEKALEIHQKTLPPNHRALATSVNNIGLVYNNMGEYTKALSSHKKALEIHQKTLPPNHPHLATSVNNIGLVYDNMGEYSKALSSHEKTIEILEKTLPVHHPLFGSSYNNIASVYDNMGEYSKALSFHGKALEIRQKTLPPNHPDLAISYNNIGLVYVHTGEYSKALSFFQGAHSIFQTLLPANHSKIKILERNIEFVKRL